MTAEGLTLDSGLITTATTAMTGITKTIMNVWPQVIFLGIGAFAALYVVNKIPSWIKRFLG